MALATWCAAGFITVATADSASVRIALPASAWVFAAAFAIAMVVPGWRRHPLTATPALFAVLPWLPVPLPPIAIVWTGPLAWAPIGCALVAAIVAPALKDRPTSEGNALPALKDRPTSEGNALPALKDRPTSEGYAVPALMDRPAAEGAEVHVGRGFSPGRHALAAGALTFAVSVLTAIAVAPHRLSGDEPHYLVITQSLLLDRDLDIGNNHAARDYAVYHPADLPPDFVRRGRRGEAFSIHAPGVPAIVLPAFAIFGYRGALATIVLIAAVTGALVWSIGWRVTGDRGAAWVAWAATVATPTFLIQSVTIFPDGPGALATAAAVWLLVRLQDSDRPPAGGVTIAVSIALAALPWMHTRFAALAGVLGLAVLYQIIARRAAGRLWRAAQFAALPALAAAAWFGFFYVLYGTPDPTRPYGPPTDRSLAFVPGGIAGLLFDQQFGLVAFAPVLLAAMAGGIVALITRWRRVVVMTFAAAAAYLVATGAYWMWWGGVPAPPARFLMAILPVAAIPLAIAWHRGHHAVRLVILFALAWSAGIAGCLIAVERGDLLWDVRNGQAVWLNWLGPVVNLPRGWPSFFWQLTPGDVGTEWPFVLHLTASLSAISLVVAVIVAAGARARPSQRAPMVGCGIMIAIMASVQAGWWIHRTNGLDPARSQLSALASIAAGRRPVLIGAFSVRPAGVERLPLVVRAEEAPRFRPDWPWARFEDLPAGEYAISIRTSRPRPGTLTVRVDDVREPLATYPLASMLEQSVTLPLPQGARALIVDVDEGLRQVASVTLHVRRLGL